MSWSETPRRTTPPRRSAPRAATLARRIRGVYLDRPIRDWLGGLGDPDPLVRRLAAYALGEMGPGASKAAIRALTRALADEASFVRVWAAAALAKMDPLNRDVAPVLAEALKDEAAFVRSLSAWHLGRCGSRLPGIQAAIPRLERLLADPDASVRVEAALALRALRGKGVPQRA